MAQVPFLVKGVMTVQGARKALEAGASGIVVSNHGGRVLDQCPATAEVLPEIAQAVGGKMKILVDGEPYQMPVSDVPTFANVASDVENSFPEVMLIE